MTIPEFGTLQMVRTDAQHFGTGKVLANNSLTETTKNTTLLHTTEKSGTKSFQDYLMEGLNTVNSQQMDVSNLQEKLITDPDSVDVHDVTIAMQKARMSLNLAQSVIDRLVTGWNEISTTR